MTENVQVLLMGALNFGVPLGLAVREIVASGRGRGGGAGRVRPEPEPVPTPPALPDCLRPRRLDPDDPRLASARPRELVG